MAWLYTEGQICDDPELKTSSTKKPYLRLTLREWIGYGEGVHPQYTEVIAWGELAEQLHRAELQHGAAIWVSGSLELESYVRKDGVTHDKRLKLRLEKWGCGSERKQFPKKLGRSCPPVQKIQILDGEREPLPE